MQRYPHKHFMLRGHSGFLRNVSITLTDKTDPNFPTKPKDNLIGQLTELCRENLSVRCIDWVFLSCHDVIVLHPFTNFIQ